jgi:hypothetical protein
MGAELILTDSAWHDIAYVSDISFDLAFGDSENDFELTINEPAERFDRSKFGQESLVYVENSEYGGIVDSIVNDYTGGVSTLTYKGRSWHGILAGKTFSPDTGQSALVVSGQLDSVITSLLQRISVDSLFVLGEVPSIDVSSYQFDANVDAYAGLTALLASSGLGLRPGFRFFGGQVHIDAVPVQQYGSVIDSDVLDFTSEQDYRPVNHMVGLGADQATSNWYADETGAVSQTQSLFGIDEVKQVYSDTGSTQPDLDTHTRDQLAGLQVLSKVQVSVHDDLELAVGDTVTASDNQSNFQVDAVITKKIVKIDSGVLSISYETNKSQ